MASLKSIYAARRKAAVQIAGKHQESAIQKLKDIQYKTKLKNDQWDELAEGGSQVARNYVTHLRQYQDDLNYLIAAYRSANRQARTEPEPKFFSRPMQVDPMILEPPEFIPPEKVSTRSLMKHIHGSIMQIQKNYNEEVIRRNYPTLGDIEAEAERETDDELLRLRRP